MSDNIQVAIRVRPLNARELHDSQTRKCIQIMKSTKSVAIYLNSTTKTFNYDFVCDEDVTQEDLFETIGRPIASGCLCGYNGSIFAYGQTGSGKTYTIMGSMADASINFNARGILPRCLEFIFASIKKEVKKNIGLQYLIKCSFLEIYNEQINDMISPEYRNLQIREDIKKGAYVDNLHQQTVTNFDETFEVLEKGVKNRHIGSTSMNKESSRSHSVFTLHIESKEKREDVLNFKNSLFHLIDLAGSERQKLTEAFGDRLKEAGMINKSLSSLGNVINSLVEISEGKSRHVPYRDSKLTFLLKDSLGGNSKTCIIANISASCMSYGETLSTLRFAERAKMVTNKAVINEDTMGTISELKEEVKRLKKLLSSQETQAPAYSADFSERIKVVEGLLEQNLRIRLQTESALQVEVRERQEYIENLTLSLEKCEKKIVADRKLLKAKDENIKKLQKNEGIAESRIVAGLKEEIQALRNENENHPMASRLSAENTRLKHQISTLEGELKESSLSMVSRLKENQDFTEKLQLALRKSANEREQLHILLEEYSKKAKSDNPPNSKELTAAKKQMNELKAQLELERNRVIALENQLNSITESQNLEDASSSKFSTLNSSGVVSPSIINRQEDRFNKYLNENDRFSIDFEDKLKKVNELEAQVEELEQENKLLRKYEYENSRYEDEIYRLKDENMQKENKIDELQNEIETIMAENEFLSTQLIDFVQQSEQKDKKISELTEKLSARPNKDQIEETFKAKQEVEETKRKAEEFYQELKKLKEEFEVSIQSRETMIEELKKLQSEELNLRSECLELKNQVVMAQEEALKLRENNEELNTEIIQVSGMNNLNQKIKLHAKMKDENNKLKENNYQLREDLRKKNEKVELLMGKFEAISKSLQNKEPIDIGFYHKEKVENLTAELSKSAGILEEINELLFSLPFAEEIKGDSLSEKLNSAFNVITEDLNERQSSLEEAQQELNKKESRLKILESELILLRQKMGKSSKN